MPTPAEKRALVFLSALLTLGAGVRATKALSAEPPPPSAVARADLHRQIVAVDSADSVERSGGGKRHRSKRPVARGVSTSDGSDASVRVDSSVTSSRKRKKGTKILPRGSEQAHDIGVSSAGPVDLDRAQEWEILALPKVGPTLAHRILANRDSLGPFGSLDELSDRLLAFGKHYRNVAPRFEWTFTRHDLDRVLASIADREPHQQLTA